jgi:hypothetical protein
MLSTTSAEWTPWAIASAQAVSTAGRPSVRTALRMSTICRLLAIVGTGELAPYTFNRCRQYPVLEGSAVTQGAGLASEHRHVMPGIVGRLAAAE